MTRTSGRANPSLGRSESCKDSRKVHVYTRDSVSIIRMCVHSCLIAVGFQCTFQMSSAPKSCDCDPAHTSDHIMAVVSPNDTLARVATREPHVYAFMGARWVVSQ